MRPGREFLASEDDGLASSTEGKARHRHALIINVHHDPRSLQLLLKLPPELTGDLVRRVEIEGLKRGMHGPQHRPTRKPMGRRHNILQSRMEGRRVPASGANNNTKRRCNKYLCWKRNLSKRQMKIW